MHFDEFVGFKNAANVRTFLTSVKYHPYHIHKNVLEIIAVLQGSINIFDSTLHRSLFAGDIYIFNAKEGHKLSSDDANNILLTVHIDIRHYLPMVPELLDAYFLCDSYASCEKNTSDLYQLRFLLAKLFFQYYADTIRETHLQEQTIDILHLLLAKYSNYYYATNFTGKYEMHRKIEMAPYTNENSRIYRIINYIYDHCKENLRLYDIAKLEFLTTSYLSRYIKNNAGFSFSELLSLARCDEAELLLINTQMNIDKIAHEVGFSNRYHFCENFKKWFGETPSAYRKNLLSDLSNTKKLIYSDFNYQQAIKILNAYLDGYIKNISD